MEFDVLFNATVGVFWAVFYVPHLLREKKYKVLGIAGTGMLIVQITISMNYALREFPYNFLAGVSIFFLSLLVGYTVYYFENRKHKEES